MSSPAQRAPAPIRGERRAQDREGGQNRAGGEREHPRRVDDRDEAAAAVLELDVAHRHDAAASTAAFALLLLRRVRAAARPEPEARSRDRNDRHAVALDRRAEHGGATELRPYPLGEQG